LRVARKKMRVWRRCACLELGDKVAEIRVEVGASRAGRFEEKKHGVEISVHEAPARYAD
jgi:hypothetical protein